MSQYQKGKTNLDFTETRDTEWQWHQLGCMQICTLLLTDNHASTPPLIFYRPDALPATQPTVLALKAFKALLILNGFEFWLHFSWDTSCRLPTASPGRWIGGRPPDMVASCDLSG